MNTRIKKWGNSLALRIPRPLALEVGLEEEAEVTLTLADGKLIIAPVPELEWTLEGLLAHVTPENLHDEVDTGTARGREAW